MEFRKYQHIERLGTDEVSQIEMGTVYVFPKLDGSNASLWMHDGRIQAGSRRRHLSLSSDNAGFLAWAQDQHNIIEFFKDNPGYRLFGEWLVPHSFKDYRDEAWRNFYVFDVCTDKDERLHDGDSYLNYVHYEGYAPTLEHYQIDYIPPICVIENGDTEQFYGQLSKNVFLVEDGKTGEGIVLKNYDYRNKYGRQTWAKIITSEFKDMHRKEMGVTALNGKDKIEQKIAEKYVTEALCEKVMAKIKNEDGWSSKYIPRLLNTVYYEVVREDSWNFIKEHKHPTINFTRLKNFVFGEVKNQLPNVF